MNNDNTPQPMAMQQLQGSGMNDWYAGYAEGVSDGQKMAADRIEALEKALRKIMDCEELDAFTLQDIARAALAPEQDK